MGANAQGWSGELAMDRTGTFAVSGRTLQSGRAEASYEARTITSGARGFALWDHEVANRTAAPGAGTWTATPGSWVAAVLGATQGAATFEHSTFSLPSAWVHWPGQEVGPVDESPQRPPDGIELPSLLG